MLDIFTKQNSTKVIVGDTHQQIYGWRNAINSLEKVDYPNYSLNTSYRFNNSIARLASTILDWKAYLGAFKSVDILGNGINNKLKVKAIIARSNLGLLLKAIEFITENPRVKKIYFEGNFNSYTYADEGASLYDVLNLSSGKRHLIKDSLISNMKNIDELEEYIESTEDRQLSMMLEIVNEYGNEIYDLLQNIKSKHVENSEKEQAEMIFSTVHRSKGMEYDEVLLVDDFITEESIDKQINNLERNYNSAKIQEDINLLYVAVTRTKNILHIPEGLLPKGFPQLESINVIKKPEKISIEKQNTVKKKTYNNFNKFDSGQSSGQAKPKESYQTWTPALDAELIKLFKKGRSIQELAHIFGRSKGSIWARVKKLDLGDYYSE
jgi:ATP-dependent exoDNAse (exonuclease V) beta subunit